MKPLRCFVLQSANLRVVMPEVLLSSYTLAEMAQGIGIRFDHWFGNGHRGNAGRSLLEKYLCAYRLYGGWSDRGFGPHCGGVDEPSAKSGCGSNGVSVGAPLLWTVFIAVRSGQRRTSVFGKLGFSNTDELQSGSHAVLDRICAFLLGQAPFLLRLQQRNSLVNLNWKRRFSAIGWGSVRRTLRPQPMQMGMHIAIRKKSVDERWIYRGRRMQYSEA